MRRRENSRVCSGSVRPGAACPCSGSLLKIRTRIETSWAGSNPCLNTFYFVVFLMGMHYMLYRGVSFAMRSGFGAEKNYGGLGSQRSN